MRLEIKGYPHLCIRNTTEAQTPTLIGTAAEGKSCFANGIDLVGGAQATLEACVVIEVRDPPGARN
jgi:hypothetical protein